MKNKIIIALLVFTTIIIANQIVFFIDINNQYSNSEIINVAGRQRMYSQRIMKLILSSQVENNNYTKEDDNQLDTSVDNFSKAHDFLKEQNQEKFSSEKLDSLFNIIEKPYSNILKSYAELETNQLRDSITISKEKLEDIKSNEQEFLKNMDAIVNTYQVLSQERLTRLSNIQLLFNIIAALLIVYVFTFIILPLSKKQNKTT